MALQTSPAVAIRDGANLDAFARLRVSQAVMMFSGVQDYDLRPRLYDTFTATGGTATHLPNERACAMTVTTTSGSLVRRATREAFVYRTGQSQLVFATFVFAAAQAGLRQRVGLFDQDNGVFLEQTSSARRFVIRSYATGAVVDAAMEQADWNLDRLDGTGPSGITLDLTKPQILVIDLQWLGVGRVRYGFDLDGVVVYAHQALNANRLQTTVYMTTPSLPVTYEIHATAALGAGATMRQICASVAREGDPSEPGLQRARDTGPVARSTAANLTTMIGIRINPAWRNSGLRLADAQFHSLDNVSNRWSLCWNPTITAPVWQDVPNSPCQWTATAISVSAENEIIDSGFVPGNSSGASERFSNEVASLGGSRANHTLFTPDALFICAQTFSGAGTGAFKIRWNELR